MESGRVYEDAPSAAINGIPPREERKKGDQPTDGTLINWLCLNAFRNEHDLKTFEQNHGKDKLLAAQNEARVLFNIGMKIISEAQNGLNRTYSQPMHRECSYQVRGVIDALRELWNPPKKEGSDEE
jgi:hypothetical protein